MHLHGKTLWGVATAEQGVVSADTRLDLVQRDTRIMGRYQGGSIGRRCLLGHVDEAQLRFGYAQREADGHIHGGRSVRDLDHWTAGRLRIVEHFTWDTRAGSGTNMFEGADGDVCGRLPRCHY